MIFVFSQAFRATDKFVVVHRFINLDPIYSCINWY